MIQRPGVRAVCRVCGEELLRGRHNKGWRRVLSVHDPQRAVPRIDVEGRSLVVDIHLQVVCPRCVTR